ncbi:MAG: hypothetical protein ACM3OH_13770, partial [Bacillota bacterium]
MISSLLCAFDVRRRRPGIPALLLVAALAWPVPLAAQLAGRWLVTIPSFSSTAFRGELRLRQSGAALTGTLWLGSSESPVPIRDGTIRGDSVEFGPADGPRFAGLVTPAGDLGGRIRVEGGAGPQWIATRLSEDAEYYPTLP